MSLIFRNVRKISRRSSRSRSRTKNVYKNVFFENERNIPCEEYQDEFPPLKHPMRFKEPIAGTSDSSNPKFDTSIGNNFSRKAKSNSLPFKEEYYEKSFEELRWEDYQSIEDPQIANKTYSQCLIKNKLCCQKNQSFLQLSKKPEIFASRRSSLVDFTDPHKDDMFIETQTFTPMQEDPTISDQNGHSSNSNQNERKLMCPNYSNQSFVYYGGNTPTNSFVNTNFTAATGNNATNNSFSKPSLKTSKIFNNSTFKFQNSLKISDSLKKSNSLSDTKSRRSSLSPEKTCLKGEKPIRQQQLLSIDQSPKTASNMNNSLNNFSSIASNVDSNKNTVLGPFSFTNRFLPPQINQFSHKEPKKVLSKIGEESTTNLDQKVIKERSIHTLNEALKTTQVFRGSVVTSTVQNTSFHSNSTSHTLSLPQSEGPLSREEQCLFPNTTWFLRDNISDQFGFNRTLNSVEPLFENGNLYAEYYDYSTVALDLFKTINPQDNPIVNPRKDFHALFSPYTRPECCSKKSYLNNILF